MKALEKDELYQHLGGFLKSRGIELREGSYAQGIQKSCHLLSEAINLGQKGIDQAKSGIDKKLDQMRQVIHEKTAPKSAAAASPPPPPVQSVATKTSARKPRAKKRAKVRK